MSAPGDDSKKTLSVGQRAEVSLAISRKRGDETIGTHSQDGDRSVSAEKNAEGEIAWQVEGRRPQGDKGELPCASTLIQKLNSEGKEWDQPIKVENQYWDCESVHISDRRKKLLIQVTRMGDFWKQWAKEGAVRENDAAVDDLADSILAAIRKKAVKGDWSNVVLALDAASAPQHALTTVVLEFSKKHGGSATLAGFKEIWLIGPDSVTTHRLTQ